MQSCHTAGAVLFYMQHVAVAPQEAAGICRFGQVIHALHAAI